MAYTWGGSQGEPEVVFELSPQGDGTLLTLPHRKLARRDDTLDVAAGWHTHLDVLSARLAGREPGPFWSAHGKWQADCQARIPPDCGPVQGSFQGEQALESSSSNYHGAKADKCWLIIALCSNISP